MKKKGIKIMQLILNFLHVKKANYAKATFRLSVIGFIGSIGFYIGVLRDLGISEESKNLGFEALKIENEILKNHIEFLTEKR